MFTFTTLKVMAIFIAAIVFSFMLIAVLNPLDKSENIGTFFSDAATYWRLPCASHYPQNDQPKMIAHLVRQSLSGQGATVSAILDSNCGPIRVEE